MDMLIYAIYNIISLIYFKSMMLKIIPDWSFKGWGQFWLLQNRSHGKKHFCTCETGLIFPVCLVGVCWESNKILDKDV